jgi:hypothetical protein
MRRRDWSLRLTEYILEVRTSRRKLDWAEFACCHFVGGAIKAMTDEDPHEPLVGLYKNPEEAAEVLRNMGCRDLAHYWQQYYQEIPPINAQKGDIVLLAPPNPEELPPELCYGAAIADPPLFWCINERGLARGQLSSALKAYRVI